MRKIKIIIKIIYFYILVGFFNLGISSAYLFLRDGKLDPKLVNATATIFFWPVSSFSSAKTLFGPEGAQIWNYFSIASIFFFIVLVVVLARSDEEA
ncbi:hypothetical protein ISS85_04100 [Candidatus Microgenomates bacterium]|nr:hypothetical protein [Candidatus Microgenomates bacterium]